MIILFIFFSVISRIVNPLLKKIFTVPNYTLFFLFLEFSLKHLASPELQNLVAIFFI